MKRRTGRVSLIPRASHFAATRVTAAEILDMFQRAEDVIDGLVDVAPFVARSVRNELHLRALGVVKRAEAAATAFARKDEV